MKATILSLALAIGLSSTLPAYSQAGQDVKDATHDTKTATEKGVKKSTKAVKKGATKSTDAVKKGATKSTDAVKKGVHKGADKVADKTTT